jgi:hypothetical protein
MPLKRFACTILSTEGNTGCPGATDGNSDRSAPPEAMNMFVSDMIVCLDRE